MIHTQMIMRSPEPKGLYLTTFQRKLLEKNLKESLSNQHRQRIQIMLLADEGKTQKEICESLNCCSATARHWQLMARMGMVHTWQEPVGRPKTVNDEYLERLQELVNNNPQDYGYAFERWTANWLSKHLNKELGIKIHERHVNRLLKKMGLSTRSKPTNSENSLDNFKKGRIFIQDLSSQKSEQPQRFPENPPLRKFEREDTPNLRGGQRRLMLVSLYSKKQIS